MKKLNYSKYIPDSDKRSVHGLAFGCTRENRYYVLLGLGRMLVDVHWRDLPFDTAGIFMRHSGETPEEHLETLKDGGWI